MNKSELLTKNIAYVLDGGGGKGGFQAGVLYQINKQGITPKKISSISVGALNGILVATGQYEKMKEIWHNVTDSQIREERGSIRYGFQFIKHKLGIDRPYLGFWSNEPLKKLVRKTIIGKTTIIPYYAGVVDAVTDRFLHFNIPAGTRFDEESVDHYVDYIVASATIPAVFSPVMKKGMVLVDGGIHHQSPVRPIREVLRTDTNMIIGISMKSAEQPKRKEPIADDVAMVGYIIDSLLTQNYNADKENFNLINEIAKRNGGKFTLNEKTYYYYDSLFIHPEKHLSPSTRFHHKFSRVDFAHGISMANKYIPS